MNETIRSVMKSGGGHGKKGHYPSRMFGILMLKYGVEMKIISRTFISSHCSRNPFWWKMPEFNIASDTVATIYSFIEKEKKKKKSSLNTFQCILLKYRHLIYSSNFILIILFNQIIFYPFPFQKAK